MFGKWIAAGIAWQHWLILVLNLLTPETSMNHSIQPITLAQVYHHSPDTALNEIAMPIYHLMIRRHPAHVFSFVRP